MLRINTLNTLKPGSDAPFLLFLMLKKAAPVAEQ